MRVLLLTLTTCLLVLPAYAKYSGGTGEPNDPYQIATAADLIALGETPEDYNKHFTMTADIDLDPNLPSGRVFDRAVIAPDVNDVLVSYWAPFDGTPFPGAFDGNGHTISHLTITGASYLGLFGQLGPGAEVRDLGVVDVNITGSDNHIGALVGNNHHGALTDCYSSGAVSGNYSVGGLVGVNSGSMTRCYSAGAVADTAEWPSSVGGLVGDHYGTLTQCYSTGSVSGDEEVGGLVGFVHGDVTLGGMVGGNSESGSVLNCYSTAVVSGNGPVGGLVGTNGGTLTRCYSTGAVSGRVVVGGLVGSRQQVCHCGYPGAGCWCDSMGSVFECLWDTQTSGQATSVGGTGRTTEQMKMMRTFLCWGTCGNEGIWTIDEGKDYPRLSWENRPGEVIRLAKLSDLLLGTGTENDPYLIATPEGLNIVGLFSCEWDGHFKLTTDIDMSDFDGKDGRPQFNVIAPVTPVRSETGEGSFFGHFFTGVFDGNGHKILHLTIRTSKIAGMFGGLDGEVKDLGVVDVNIASSGNYVAGLVGYNIGSVTRCYSSGVVTGSDRVGGLVGDNAGFVTYCCSTGVVSGIDGVGGLVGYNHYGYVTQSYCTGVVSGQSAVGGLVGLDDGSVTACFWDTRTSGQATSSGGTGKTTAEMQTAKTFLDAGWDFVGETANGSEDIWWINEGKDYPRLWWEQGDEASP